MTLPTVGVIYRPSGAAHIPDVCRSAESLCKPVFVFSEDLARHHSSLFAIARQLSEAVAIPADELVPYARERGLGGLTTFDDASLEHHEHAVTTLGLPGGSHAHQPWDKLEQRQRLHHQGLSRIRSRPIDSARDLPAAVADLGLPAVLKPRRGVSGGGVAFVPDSAAMRYQLANRQHWADLMLEQRLEDGHHPSKIDFLGDFASVETVAIGHSYKHVAVFDKTPVTVRPGMGSDGADLVSVTGDVTPSRLPDSEQQRVLELVEAALSTFGIRWRVTHTEVKLTPHGPEIIEINGRLGGYLHRLLRLVDGPDLVRAALSLSLGQAPDTWASTRGCAMGVFPSFPDPRQPVRSRVTLRQLRELPHVVGVDEWAEHGHPRSATANHMVNLTLHATDFPTLDHAASRVRAEVRTLFHADLTETANV